MEGLADKVAGIALGQGPNGLGAALRPRGPQGLTRGPTLYKLGGVARRVGQLRLVDVLQAEARRAGVLAYFKKLKTRSRRIGWLTHVM